MCRTAILVAALVAVGGCGGHSPRPRRAVDNATVYALTTSTGMLASAAADPAADPAASAARRRLLELHPRDATLIAARDELTAAIGRLGAARPGTPARRSAAASARVVVTRVERTLQRYLGRAPAGLVPD